MKKVFQYIEPMWLGNDNKMSIRAVLAMAFSIDFIFNLSYAIQKWSAERSLEGLSLVLGIEAGLIVSLLGITALSNVAFKKIDNNMPGSPAVTVQNAENVTNITEQKPDKPE